MARLAEAGGIAAAWPRDAAEQAGFCNLAAGGEDCIGRAACPRTRGSS
jgi:hypothetical protein